MRLHLMAIATLVAFPAEAQNLVPRVAEAPCIADGSTDNCVRNLGCIGGAGRWFTGRAIGWNAGKLRVRTSDGLICTGRWWIENSGVGRSEVTCPDGTTAELVAEYQDYATGTAIGRGVTSGGDEIVSYSGEHVLDYLGDDGRPVLPCGDFRIELDENGVPIS